MHRIQPNELCRSSTTSALSSNDGAACSYVVDQSIALSYISKVGYMQFTTTSFLQCYRASENFSITLPASSSSNDSVRPILPVGANPSFKDTATNCGKSRSFVSNLYLIVHLLVPLAAFCYTMFGMIILRVKIDAT